MKTTLYWIGILCLLGIVGCKPGTDHEATADGPRNLDADAASEGPRERTFWPDTSVNWVALMQDSAVQARFDSATIADLQANRNPGDQVWAVLNNDSTQLLSLWSSPDDPPYTFYKWEVSYLNEPGDLPETVLQLPDARFVTEHAIYLELFKEELPRRLQWEDWDIETSGDTTWYSYQLDDTQGPGGEYLSRYKEDAYSATYTFLGRRLMKMKVGFVRE